MPKPKNFTSTTVHTTTTTVDQPEEEEEEDSTTPLTTSESSPIPPQLPSETSNFTTRTTTTNSEEPPIQFKLRSYESLFNQIPRFSVDVDMSEDTTEMGVDENLENYEFSSDEEEGDALQLTEEMKLLRQSKRLKNRDSNRLSGGRLSNESNEMMYSPRNRHGGLILKKENAVLVNNLKEKMEILKNLIQHESTYLINLDLLREKFIGTLKRSDLISAEEMEKLFCFSQLNIIWNVNSELLNQFNTFYTTLEHIADQNTVVSPRASTIGQIFLRLTPFLKNYIQYSNQLETCFIAINNKRLKDSNFKSIVKKLERMCTKLVSTATTTTTTTLTTSGSSGGAAGIEPLLNGSFTLQQAMKIPLQQFVYYKKALLDLLNISQSSTEECTILNESLKLIEIVNQTFDQLLKEMQNREQFYQLNKKILKQSETGESITIIKPNRVFINEAQVYLTCTNNNYLELCKKKKKKKDNNSNAIAVTQFDIPNEKFFEDEHNKFVLIHFNDSIIICTSEFEAPKPPRNSNRETAAKRKRIKQVNSMIDSKKLRFKESIDLESDTVPWIRNISPNESPTISNYDSNGNKETVTKPTTTELSHMFQLVTWNRIYTFKFENENLKCQWMQSIQQSLLEIKAGRKQDVVDTPNAKSGGYLEIPQSWSLPSIVTIQSVIRSYFVVQKTLRIKKKSRKGNRAGRLSVIHRINQQDNKLLQNQNFAQSYPKKEAIALLKDYEEDVNDMYIVVEAEEEEIKPQRVQEQQTKVIPVEVVEAVEEEELEKKEQIVEQKIKVEEETDLIPPNVETSSKLETIPTEPSTQVEHAENHQSTAEEQEPTITNPSVVGVRKEMVDEIIYEDENGDQFYVRVGDEIVYVDENGNHVVEIVTPEKFLEIVNAADMIEEEMEEMANQTRMNEVSSNKKESTEIQKEIQSVPPEAAVVVVEKDLKIVENVSNNTTTIVESPTKVTTTVEMPEANPPQVEEQTQSPAVVLPSSSNDQQPTTTVQVEPKTVETISNPPPVFKEETSSKTAESVIPPQEEIKSTTNQPPTLPEIIPSSTTKQPTSHSSTQSKPIIPSLDILKKSSIDCPLSSPSDQQPNVANNLPVSNTPRRSVASASIDSPRKKEEDIAPWQKELLNRYKNDGKFKFVTQTAEEKIEKIARASFSDEPIITVHHETAVSSSAAGVNHAASHSGSATTDSDNMNTSSLSATSNNLMVGNTKELHRQSIRISSDFQNFLKKFKTIEQKAQEEK